MWNSQSVSKVPAFLLAMYRWLLWTGPECYGPRRTDEYEPLPKWRCGAKRLSCLDVGALLRRQIADDPTQFPTGSARPGYQTMVAVAAA